MALLAQPIGLPGSARLRRVSRAVRRTFPSLNFITLHYLYFLVTCLLSSVIFWGASTPPRSVSYVDSLFVTVSAMTLAGLNTVNLSTLNTFQQFMLFFLILIGSAIFVSAFVVLVRKRAFEKRFLHIAQHRRRRAQHAKARRRSTVQRLSRSLSRGDVSNRDIYRATSAKLDDLSKNAKLSMDDSFVGSAVAKTDDAAGSGPAMEKLPLGGPNESVLDYRLSSDNQGPTQGSIKEEDAKEANPTRQPSHTITYRSDAGDEIQINPTLGSHNDPPANITFGPSTYYYADANLSKHKHHRFLSMQGVGAHSHATVNRRHDRQDAGVIRADSEPDRTLGSANDHLPFPSSGFLSRNSQFHHLSEEEREKLGGYEYRAIRLLSWLVPTYSILFQLLGCLGLGAYVANNRASVARANGLNPWWVGAFNAVSAFNNSGMSLLDANMVAFQTSIYMLITMGLLILAGNTCYPIFLRLIVWTFSKIIPKNNRWEDFHKTLEFLLEHPRRCYTNMFPSRHTWWLLACVVCLNGIDWVGFEILNIGNDAITSLPTGIQILDGLFQALAVRSGGFYVVLIPSVRISLQVLYVIMMYISVYPVVITMRNSNVYEERSLGIYADDPGYSANQHSSSGSGFFDRLIGRVSGKSEQTKSYFVRQQLRAQLSHDLWWLVLAVFVIMIIEGSSFDRNPAVYSVFNVIFETVSAYGCVGISVGLPDQAYSFSGGLKSLSKLVLCAVMIRGRHRGLPVAIDKAVLLPGENVDEAEEEDGEIRLTRTVSQGRVV